jgi:shikimate dehydrogenase
MPLKRTVIPLLDSIDAIGTMTSAVNTVLLGSSRTGFNTDVQGTRRAIAGAGIDSVTSALVLGGGATAGSIIVALAGLGLEHATLVVRSTERAADAVDVARRAGVAVDMIGPGELDDASVPSIVVNTIPAATGAPTIRTGLLRAPLFEASYDPWPTPLARRWLASGGLVIPGIDMLVHQALVQVRIFVSGDPGEPLDHESDVLAAMFATVNRATGTSWRGA